MNDAAVGQVSDPLAAKARRRDLARLEYELVAQLPSQGYGILSPTRVIICIILFSNLKAAQRLTHSMSLVQEEYYLVSYK